MNHTTLQLEKLTCPSCMQKIIDTVNDLAGVEQTKILFDRSKARDRKSTRLNSSH